VTRVVASLDAPRDWVFMFRVLLLGMIAATIPFLVYSGMRHRLKFAVSLTATAYLVLYGLRLLSGFWFFREELENTIGIIVVICFVAIAAYTVFRYYGDRAVRRKLAERAAAPDAHRSVIDNLWRSFRN
jgi:4-hydroxybenzoate polyprenyltransferase